MSQVKAVVINKYFGLGGGAEVFATRVLNELNQRGQKAVMLVAEKTADSEVVFEKPSSLIDLIIRKLSGKDWTLARIMHKLTGIEDQFFLWPLNIVWDKNFRKLELIHAHNIQGNYLSLAMLTILSWKYKVVWTLHDGWTTNSKSSYVSNAKSTRLKSLYPALDIRSLDEYAQLPADQDRVNNIFKKICLKLMRATVVCSSQWLESVVKNDKVFSRFSTVTSIHNGIELDNYRNIGKLSSRKKLEIPEDKTVIYCQAGWIQDHKKGIIALFQNLPKDNYQDYFFICTGYGSEVIEQYLPEESGRLIKGYVDNNDVATYFSAADIYLMPSFFENYSTTLLESHAAGTACVAFDIGGNNEIIDNGETGFLIEPYDMASFWAKVFELADNVELRNSIADRARAKALKDFGIEDCLDKYIDLLNQK